MQIFVNGRFRSHKITGIQRYAHELTSRLSFPVFEPFRKLKGWRGHAWEQTVLPARSLSGLLWSPCAAGPLASLRHIVTFHDLFPLDSPGWYSSAFARGYRFLLTALSRTATHLIAVSQYTKERLVQRLHVEPDRITVIHSGIDSALFRPSPLHPSARAELKLPPGRYFLCVGSLEPRKNLRTLLIAWSQVLPEIASDIHLVVTGTRDEAVYNSLDFPTIPDRVIFTGYVPDQMLPGLYSSSLAFVYPSLGEGFGFPPLEAMSCGTPVITSNVTALPEVCGNAALYFAPTDASALARQIKFLCSEKSARTRLSELGRNHAKQFSWDRAAAETATLLSRFASRNNAHPTTTKRS